MSDQALFFTMLFGSDKFEHLIGELAVATSARLGDTATTIDTERAQHKRVADLTDLLVARLESWEQTPADFIAAASAEASELVELSYGPLLLKCIGQAYVTAAEDALGGLTAVKSSIRSFGSSVNKKFSLFRAAATVHFAQERTKKKIKDEEASGEVRSEAEVNQMLEADTMPAVFKALSVQNEIDIAETLKRVCLGAIRAQPQQTQPPAAASHGKSDDGKTERIRHRATGLLELGKTFKAQRRKGPTAEQTFEDFRSRVHAAAEAATLKKQQDREAHGS